MFLQPHDTHATSRSLKMVGLAIGVVLTALLAGVNGAAQSLNPVPFIQQPLVPTSAAPGGGAFTLTVNGAGFVPSGTVPGSVVEWNGSPRTTTFVNSRQLTASILAADIAVAGTASVTVVNPTPGGGTSNVRFFHVVNPISPLTFSLTSYPTGASPLGGVARDFNADGFLDLAVANVTDSTVSVLLGNGDGTFQAKVDYATGGSPYSLTTADLNGDGKPDLAAANASDNTVSVLLGNGDGTFQAKVDYATGFEPHSPIAADFNGDGKLDLATTNNTAYTISILLGNGDGTFQPNVDYATNANPWSVTTADFNADGKLDLAVANASAFTVSVFLGNGDGTFQAKVDYAAAASFSVSTADFNGDGKLDLAVANLGGPTVSVLLGNGDGTFQTKVDYATSAVAYSVTTGDFNGDGKLDVATENTDSTVSILLGNGDGTFQAKADYAAGGTPYPYMLAAGDFDGDGRLDLATNNYSDNTISVLLQRLTPVVQLSTSSLTFGSQVVSTTSPVQQVTLTNTGNAALNFTSFNVQVSTTDTTLSPDFSQNNTCGTGIAAGANCTLNVFFTPLSLGPKSAVIKIVDNALDSPQFESLSGTGISLGLVGGLPATFAFGDQRVGTTSAPQKFTLNNTGAGTLGISSIQVTGEFALDTGLSTCGPSLLAAASCDIYVTFTPQTAGFQVGALNVNHDGAGSPATVALTGNGLAPEVSFLDESGQPITSVDFHKQNLNTTSPVETVTVKNIGTAPLQISSIVVGSGSSEFARSGGTCSGSTTLAIGDTCTIGLTYTPTTTAVCSYSYDSITVNSDAPGGASALSLQGLVAGAGGLAVNNLGSQSPSTLVNNLLGPGVTASNIAYKGTSRSSGTFTGGTGIIGFDSGIVLSSGTARDVVGPNCSDGITGVNGLPGDADLATLSAAATFDATVLEFDFVPTTNSLTFQYVFSSDEYNEYANSSFNNVFGFFVNGTNVALIPSTTTPVAINNVNGGNPLGTNAQNPVFYINNDVNDGGGSVNTEMDGLTVVLTAQATVNAGQVNHIKLGIADAGDSVLDSNVFIRAGSFSSLPAISFVPSSVNFPGNPLNLNCPSKPVTVSNTGTVPLSISSFAVTAPFFVNPANTTCSAPSTLQPGASCIIAVKFQPTTVGPAQGTLTISSDAVSGSEVVSLTGNGMPACSLLAKVRSTTLLRGTDAQDFEIADGKPSCTPVSLNLSCSVANPAACALNPAVIAPSGASTLRVSNLRGVTADSVDVQVNSVSEFRTASELISVRFADFAFTQAPDTASVLAGETASYALAIRPVNGLAGALALTCSGAPRGATCTVQPSSVELDGSSLAQVKVRVSTTARAGALGGFQLPPLGGQRGLPLLMLLLVAVVGGSAAVSAASRQDACAPRFTRLVLGVAMLAMLLWASCGGGGSMNFKSGGTPAGTFTLTITGTYTATQGTAPATLTNTTNLTLKVN